LLRAAVEAYQAGNYAAAAEAYKRFVDEFADSPLRAEAEYWYGESLYQQGKYTEAIGAYKQALQWGLSEETAPFGLYSIARAYLETGQNQSAAAALEQFLDKYPQHELAAECTYLLAGVLSAQGQPQRAIELYERVLADFPQSSFAQQARWGLAFACRQAGRLQQARDLFAQIAAAGGKNALAARLHSAECEYLLGEYEAASRDYANVPQTAAEYEQARYGLALCYEALNQAQAARQIYLKLAADAEPEVAACAALRLGDGYCTEGKYEAAQSWYAKAATLSKRSIIRDEAKLGLIVVANMQQASADNAAAAEEIARRHAHDDLGAHALYEAGRMYLSVSRFQEATRCLRASIAARPQAATVPEALLAVGQCLKKQGDSQAALATWEEVISRFAESAAASQAYRLIVATHLEAGRLQEARQTVEQYARALPADQHLATALLDVASAEYEAGDLQAAYELCEKALDADVRGTVTPWATYQLGLIALRRGDTAEAWSQLVQVEEHAPAQQMVELLAAAEAKVAEQYFETGRYAEAAACYEYLLEHHPASDVAPIAHYKLGWCLLRMGRSEAAADQFMAALEGRLEPAAEADARYQAAQLLDNRKDYAGAQDVLLPFLERLADTRPRVHALILLGRVAMKTGEVETAREAFADAIEGLSDEQVPLSALAGLATAQEQLGRTSQAIATLQRAVRLAQGDTGLQLRRQLARCYAAAGQWLQAAAEYDKISTLYSGAAAASALLEAGKLYQQQGETEAAQTRYHTLLNKYPNLQPYAQQARLRLQEIM